MIIKLRRASDHEPWLVNTDHIRDVEMTRRGVTVVNLMGSSWPVEVLESPEQIYAATRTGQDAAPGGAERVQDDVADDIVDCTSRVYAVLRWLT